MLQHGSYTLLIDACYDREDFPTLEQAIEWVWASTTEEIEAVTFVLRKFFTLENGIYVQKRIQEEILEYQAKAETNTRIAIERETKRREKSTVRAPVVHQSSPDEHEPSPSARPSTNQEPLTTNHKPITNNQNKNTNAIAPPDGVVESVWADFKKLRSTKKAPITQTAMDGISREAGKAGISLGDALAVCCERGWTGFKADWVAQNTSGSPINKQEALEARNRAIGQRWADGEIMAGAI